MNQKVATYLGHSFGLKGRISYQIVTTNAVRHRLQLSDSNETLVLKERNWFQGSIIWEPAPNLRRDVQFHLRCKSAGASTTTPRLTTDGYEYARVGLIGNPLDAEAKLGHSDFIAYVAAEYLPGTSLVGTKLSPDEARGVLYERGRVAAYCVKANHGIGDFTFAFPDTGQDYWRKAAAAAESRGAIWVDDLLALVPDIVAAEAAMPPFPGRYVRPTDLFPRDALIDASGRTYFTDWEYCHGTLGGVAPTLNDSLGGRVGNRRISQPDESERQVWNEWATARGLRDRESTEIVGDCYRAHLAKWNLPLSVAEDSVVETARDKFRAVRQTLTGFIGFSGAAGRRVEPVGDIYSGQAARLSAEMPALLDELSPHIDYMKSVRPYPTTDLAL